MGRFLFSLTVVFFFLAALVILAGGLVFSDLTVGLPPPQTLEVLLNEKNGQLLQPTRIYDRSNQHLLLTLENPGIPRQYLSISPDATNHFSLKLVQMITARDDPDFWKNPGISISSLLNPEPVTIAEKLIDRMLLSQEQPGLRRTLRMRILALQTTAIYGREKILEWHLNSIYFGHLAYGAESAARLYFDKSAGDLNLAEAALLLEIEKSPALNPLDAPAAVEEQKLNSLNWLLLQKVITPAEFLQASNEKINLRKTIAKPESAAPAFTHYLLNQLGQQMDPARLEQGGLRITSTLDYDLQINLICVLRTQLGRLEDKETKPDPACQAASLLPTLPPSKTPSTTESLASGILIDPQSGEILALAGKLDLAGETETISGMKSGSILTPLAALSGFTRGMAPASLVWDVPSSLPENLAEYRLTDANYKGPMRLRTALGNDYLTPLTNLLLFLGPDEIARQAEPLGLNSLAGREIPPDFFYQGEEVNLVEVAQVYSAFANLGRINGVPGKSASSVMPAAVNSIVDLNGRVLWDTKNEESREVISPPLAYLIHNVLADDNARRLSLGYPNALEIGRPAGAKIGTAGAGKEVWAAGYTPQRLAVIWSGQSGGDQTSTVDVRAAGGIWHALMQYAVRGLPVRDWSAPAGIVQADVCDPSGLLPTKDCVNSVREVFVSGTEPTAADTLFKSIPINRETGRIATVFTPPDLVEERIFINYPREARAWALATGQAAAPEDYDVIQTLQRQPGVQISKPEAFAYIHGKVPIIGTAAGDGFSLYRLQIGEGLNPSTWQQIGEDGRQKIENGELGNWDTSGLNGLYAIRLMVVREDKKISTSVIQVSVDNDPPGLKVPYPTDGQVFAAPQAATITFQAEAVDLIGVKQIEWLVDGVLVGERKQAPFSLPWQSIRGQHVLAVRAYDLAGNITESQPIKFTVGR